MTTPRRAFLKSGAMTALAAALLAKAPSPIFAQRRKRTNPAVDFPVPYQAQLDPVFYYNMATFTPYIGGIFTGHGQRGQSVEMQLVSVTDCAVRSKTRLSLGKLRTSDCFALLFSAAQPLTELTTIQPLEHGA